VLREELNRHFSEQAATLRAATQYAPGIAGVAAGLSEGSMQEKLAQASRIDAESEALAAELDRLEQELDRLDPESAMQRFATLAAALNGMVAGTEDAIARVQDVVPGAVDVVYEATEPVAAPAPRRVRSARAAAPSV
jgi:ABC-type transporter Mla subunit MlaD